MQLRFDIVIAGGGLGGMTLALAVAQAGFSVAIVDPHPTREQRAPEFDGRSYALAIASCRLLANLGLWRALARNSQAIKRIRVSDGHAGDGPSPLVMQFDHNEIEDGPMGHMLEDRHLRAALLDAVQASPRIERINARITGQAARPGGIEVRLATGGSLAAGLLVGADGRGSDVARHAGIRRLGWDYGQTALVCAVAHERAHNGIAHQFFMPSGPLAILPLTGERCGIVWSETRAQANAFMALSETDFLTMLRPRFGRFLGEIARAGRRFSYPLSLSLAYRMAAERVALIGDAAHGVHPIAGQGLNAGFRDIAALAEVLTDARRRGEDPGATATLARFEDWRRFDNAALALATDSFNRLFSNANPLLQGARRLGMGAVARLPFLRRGFIREAAGLTGTIPRLMRA